MFLVVKKKITIYRLDFKYKKTIEIHYRTICDDKFRGARIVYNIMFYKIVLFNAALI